jgi:hypothetical protein
MDTDAKSLRTTAGSLNCKLENQTQTGTKQLLVANRSEIYRGLVSGHAEPPGCKPRLYVSQDGRRYLLQKGSTGGGQFNNLIWGLESPQNLPTGKSTLRQGGRACTHSLPSDNMARLAQN